MDVPADWCRAALFNKQDRYYLLSELKSFRESFTFEKFMFVKDKKKMLRSMASWQENHGLEDREALGQLTLSNK